MSITTLRYYDEIGLMKPEKKAESGYRYYGNVQLLQSQFISNMKSVGLSLEEIQALMIMTDKEEIQERITEAKANAMRHLKLINNLEKYYKMAMLDENLVVTESAIKHDTLSAAHMLSMELDNDDPGYIFAYAGQELQTERNRLGLYQKAGLRILYDSYYGKGKNKLLMPMDAPKTLEAKETTFFMGTKNTVSCIVCKETSNYTQEISEIIRIINTWGLETRETPVIECLLDPGDLMSLTRILVKVHLIL